MSKTKFDGTLWHFGLSVAICSWIIKYLVSYGLCSKLHTFWVGTSNVASIKINMFFKVWKCVVYDYQHQLHCFTANHKSSPVVSWDKKVSIKCTLQNLAGVIYTYCFMNTMNSDILLFSRTVFTCYIVGKYAIFNVFRCKPEISFYIYIFTSPFNQQMCMSILNALNHKSISTTKQLWYIWSIKSV